MLGQQYVRLINLRSIISQKSGHFATNSVRADVLLPIFIKADLSFRLTSFFYYYDNVLDFINTSLTYYLCSFTFKNIRRYVGGCFGNNWPDLQSYFWILRLVFRKLSHLQRSSKLNFKISSTLLGFLGRKTYRNSSSTRW